ncbi:MAG: YbaN family protein [Melioribacteraceae bacterium]
MTKIIYKILGLIFVAIGIIGIFLPLLPTTVFLIIASFFFLRSAPELNDKLLKNKYLGVYLKNYKEKSGVPIIAKVSSLFLLWISIFLSGYFLTENIYIRLILLMVAVGVSIHILSMKNLKSQQVVN